MSSRSGSSKTSSKTSSRYSLPTSRSLPIRRPATRVIVESQRATYEPQVCSAPDPRIRDFYRNAGQSEQGSDYRRKYGEYKRAEEDAVRYHKLIKAHNKLQNGSEEWKEKAIHLYDTCATLWEKAATKRTEFDKDYIAYHNCKSRAAHMQQVANDMNHALKDQRASERWKREQKQKGQKQREQKQKEQKQKQKHK